MKQELSFSQRQGIEPVRKVLQIDSMDQELKNSLWSLLNIFYWEKFEGGLDDISDGNRIKHSNLDQLFETLWFLYFKEPIDTIPEYYKGRENCGLAVLRKHFFAAPWNKVYDFIEFVAKHGLELDNQSNKFMRHCNQALERENAAYRFINGQIALITSSEEIEEIESAIEESKPYPGVAQHLDQALSLLSDRENPDYRNSIKESISAVESLCKQVSGKDKATLGDALKRLEEKDALHPALKEAFSKLYGYTNDADGIRHGSIEEFNVTPALARFMLISCSAFTNYVIASIPDNE